MDARFANISQLIASLNGVITDPMIENDPDTVMITQTEPCFTPTVLQVCFNN